MVNISQFIQREGSDTAEALFIAEIRKHLPADVSLLPVLSDKGEFAAYDCKIVWHPTRNKSDMRQLYIDLEGFPQEYIIQDGTPHPKRRSAFTCPWRKLVGRLAKDEDSLFISFGRDYSAVVCYFGDFNGMRDEEPWFPPYARTRNVKNDRSAMGRVAWKDVLSKDSPIKVAYGPEQIAAILASLVRTASV